MIDILLAVPIIGWFFVMGAMVFPTDSVKNLADRVTKGRHRSDRVPLQLMLDHLQKYPELWSISRTSAAFPKEGRAKEILIDFEKGKWSYSLASLGDNFRPLTGHYEKQFVNILTAQASQQEAKLLIRNFYDEGTLLLR